MTTQSSSSKSAWLWFFVWLVIIILMLIYVRQFFWLALPGTVTYFAKAMNLLDPNTPEDQGW
ncbi:MAG: hypothetical protein DI598_05500 [Pseudopedobacter saltans]|uniref:Uncharacterized protein n=1 Tax=Pseudopedobacter saltans TaxID=151895 RepID=A0A2W5H4D7_9SPHI|nr:MAG: hypothetical protein DI598_05500 [Pseudopedobacter saltans]